MENRCGLLWEGQLGTASRVMSWIQQRGPAIKPACFQVYCSPVNASCSPTSAAKALTLGGSLMRSETNFSSIFISSNCNSRQAARAPPASGLQQAFLAKAPTCVFLLMWVFHQRGVRPGWTRAGQVAFARSPEQSFHRPRRQPG